MKVTWRAAISGHEATFSQTSGFLDPVAPKMCWVLATGVITICTQSGVLSKRAEAGLALARLPLGSKREARPLSLLRPLLSFPASPPGSLTSLIYGEQSEKTSPSDISLEMEHKDKVSAGWARAGRGWAVLAPGSSAAVCRKGHAHSQGFTVSQAQPHPAMWPRTHSSALPALSVQKYGESNYTYFLECQGSVS